MTSNYSNNSDYKAVMKVFWRLAKRAGYRGIPGSPGMPVADASRIMKQAWRLVKRGEN